MATDMLINYFFEQSNDTLVQIGELADVSVEKIDTIDPVIAGDAITYTIDVLNKGPSVARSATLMDIIPANLKDPKYSIDEGATWTPWTGTLALGDLAVGSTIIQIRGKVRSTATGNMSNIVIVSSPTPDPNPDNNTGISTIQVTTSADIFVEVTVDDLETIIAGQTITYTIVISNAGPSVAQIVSLTDTIPQNLQNPECSIDGGITWNPWMGVWELSDLEVGDKRIQVRGTLSASAMGAIDNILTVDSLTLDPNSDNNNLINTIEINTLADLTIDSVESPDSVVVGHTFTYTILVSNEGPSVARKVTLTDEMSEKLLHLEYTLDEGDTWTPWIKTLELGDLEIASRTIQIRGIVDPSAVESLSHTVAVNSLTRDPNPNNTLTVTTGVDTIADIAIVKVDSQDSVIAGNSLTYTLEISNSGPSIAQMVTLREEVSENFRNPEYSIDEGDTWIPWIGTLALGDLEIGSRRIQMKGTVSPAVKESLNYTVMVESQTPDPNPHNNITKITPEVDTVADLAIVEIDTQDSVVAGEILTYTLEVSNKGPSVAQKVTLTNETTENFQNPEYSVDGELTWTPWIGTLELGDMEIENRRIQLRGMISPLTIESLSHTVTVDSLTLDPNLNNNTALITMEVKNLADIFVEKIGMLDSAIAGETITYHIDISNEGPSVAQRIILTDEIPEGLENPECSVDGGITWTPWIGTLELGDLEIGNRRIQTRGVISPTAMEKLIYTVTVDSLTPDPDLDNNMMTATAEINTLASLVISQIDTPDSAIAGNEWTYTMEISNEGPSVAKQVALTNKAPAAFRNPEYSIDEGVTWNVEIEAIELGNMLVGSSKAVLMRGIVDQSAIGTLSNTVTINSLTQNTNPQHATASITTQIDTLADLSIGKLGKLEKVIAGEVMSYAVAIQNQGPSAAREVILTHNILSELQTPEYSIDNGNTWLAWIDAIHLGDIVPQGSMAVDIRGVVNTSVVENLIDTITIQSQTTDPNPDNNKVTEVIQVTTLAEMMVSKVVSPELVVAGTTLKYTIQVMNNGPSDAHNVVMNNEINLETLEYSIDEGNTWLEWHESIALGTVPVGVSQMILVRGVLSASAIGELVSVVTIQSETPMSNLPCSVATMSIPIDAVAIMSITNHIAEPPVIAGEEIIYILEVSNNGPSDAREVVVRDMGNLQSLTYSVDDEMTWDVWDGSVKLGIVAAGTTKTIRIKGKVSPAELGVITNTATVESTTINTEITQTKDTITVSVESLADMSIVKSIDEKAVVAGKEAIYRLVVTNNGPSNAQGVVVEDRVQLQDSEYSLDYGETWMPWLGSVNLGSVVTGEEKNILIRGIVSASVLESLSNTASVISTTPHPNPENSTVTIDTLVNTFSDLSVTSTASPSPVNPGDAIVYMIHISNEGPSNAQSVELIDQVSKDIENPRYSIDSGITWSAWEGKINLGTVVAGTSQTVLIQGEVSCLVRDSLVNTAMISTPTAIVDSSKIITTEETCLNKLEMIESADKTGAVVGDRITYSIGIMNQGETLAENIIITNQLDSRLRYEGNLELDGIPIDGSVIKGISIKSLEPRQMATLRFDVEVIEVPQDDTITTQSVAEYVYREHAESLVMPGTLVSNPVELRVYSPQLSIGKLVSEKSVVVGKSFNYTMNITNNGDAEFSQVMLRDELPTSFVIQSMMVNGESINGDIGKGINIGTLATNQTKEIKLTIKIDRTIDFANFNNEIKISGDILVDTDRSPYTMTMTARDEEGVTIYNPVAVCRQSTDKSYVIVGEEITYTVTVTNEINPNLNNIPLKDIRLYEVLPSELAFIPGTVTLNGVSLPNVSILTGVALEKLEVNETKTITFKARNISDKVTSIVTTATIEGNYEIP